MFLLLNKNQNGNTFAFCLFINNSGKQVFVLLYNQKQNGNTFLILFKINGVR